MMLDRIIVHVGAHKTGSTSIQESLLELRHAVEEAGVHVPMTQELVAPNHSFLAQWIFSGEWDDVRVWIARECDGALRSGKSALLVTGEDLSVLKAAEVEALVEIMNGYASSISVDLYVRNKSQYYLSQYLHWLTHNQPTDEMQFVEAMHFSPRDCVEAWQTQPQVRLRMTRVEEISDVAVDFLTKRLGLTPSALRANRSLDPVTSILVNQVAKRVPNLDVEMLTYRLRSRTTPNVASCVSVALAREVSSRFGDVNWIVDLEDGSRVALIDDRSDEPPLISRQDLDGIEGNVLAFFATMRAMLDEGSKGR